MFVLWYKFSVGRASTAISCAERFEDNHDSCVRRRLLDGANSVRMENRIQYAAQEKFETWKWNNCIRLECLLLCRYKIYEKNMNMKSSDIIWTLNISSYIRTLSLAVHAVHVSYSFLNICRKKDYIGSVDIDMVRSSYMFLSIHLCAHRQSKFRFKRRRENEMKGYGSFPSYLTRLLWNNSQFWYSTLFNNL
jgi:hypothetical protein